MINRKISVLSLALGLFAAFAVLADTDRDVAELKQAYADYEKYISEDDLESALPLAKRALELGEVVFAPDSPNLAALNHNYGSILIDLEKFGEAKPVLKSAVKRYEAIYGKESEEMILVLMDLGHASGEFYDARAQKYAYRRALRLVEKYDGRNSLPYGRHALKAGTYIFEYSRSPDAQPFLEDAVEVFTTVLGREHPSTGFAAFNLGKFNLARKRYSAARDNFLIALNSFEYPDKPSNQLEMSTHAFLVQVYEEMKESTEATKHCLAIGRMSPAREDQDYQPLFRISPKYPQVAQERGKEGHVDVRFTVDESGFVKNVAVDNSTHKYFERSALEAIESWRYAPRFEEGEPVSTDGVRTRLTFQFSD